MKNFFRSLIFLFLITTLSSVSVFAKNFIDNNERVSLATAPPTVTSPVTYYQNCSKPLTAIPSAGGTLNWYTLSVGGVALPGAPTPITGSVGSTATYYVTQTIAGVESTPRTPIVVNVVGYVGTNILSFRCDSSQIPTYSSNYTPPATVNNSVLFDWANNPLISNTYICSYSIQGGASFTEKNPNNESHYLVPNLLPGQSVSLTLTSATHPCVPSQNITCSVPCGTSTTTPNFAPITPFCTGTPAPSLPTTSLEGISGTWLPATISNTANGSYVFTPDPILFPCALPQTLAVTITPLVTPTFSGIPTVVCQGAPAPVLPLSSSNTTPITGTWNATVDTAVLGTTPYTFTPTAGQQCVSATLQTVSIKIDPAVTPNFASIPDLCSGSIAPILVAKSPNNITGTWLPATIDNTVGGSYLFTPNPNQCAGLQMLSVAITPKKTTNFSDIPAFCSGTTAPVLVTPSPNGVSGTWSPATINNTMSGSYLFTPNSTECATTQSLNVAIIPLLEPNFVDLSICSGAVLPVLALVSPNSIAGTWLPSILDGNANGTYVFTPNVSSQCASSKTINTTIYPSNTLTSVDWAVTDAFTNNQIVTITASAAGNYSYQLDSSPFQTSPIFEYVSSGMHSVTVMDVHGCSFPITENKVFVINYPKFFTPNGDYYNDTWNIFDLKDQQNSSIYIFDRYGKLLKGISPQGAGWDGTFGGQIMPATDYWFTVEYIENFVPKIFKSHFSLKR